jgi:hypothetical protein
MVRTKRKDQPVAPIDIQQHCKKKIRQEKISSLQIKKRKQNNEPHEEKKQFKENMLANYF